MTNTVLWIAYGVAWTAMLLCLGQQALVMRERMRERRRRLQQLNRRRSRPTAEEREMSTRKSEALLKRIIGPRQYKQLRETGYIDVPLALRPIAQRERLTAVRIHQAGYVFVEIEGRHQDGMCVHAVVDDELPIADHILTFYLLAKYRPLHLLKTGNWPNKSYLGAQFL